MIGKIKNTVILFLFKATKWLKLPFKSNRLLIVRLDAIGDYVLFRNFIPLLKQHPVWGKYNFTLLGNKVFKELAEHFDAGYIDRFIWFDNNKTYRTYYKLCLLALKLKLKCYDVLVNPVHSREGYIDEFCYAIGSKNLIGSEGDLQHFKNEEQKISYDKLYNRLLPALSSSNFELFRNRFFFKHLCEDDQVVKTSIPFKKSNILNNHCYNIVIVPGAGLNTRRWSLNNFADLIAQINNLYKEYLTINFYIIGTKSDKEKAGIIIQKSNANNVIDLTGNTTLVEVTDLIGSANLVISNETSAVHIAAATNTFTICIANGKYFGRFYPYPNTITDRIQTIWPDNTIYNLQENIALNTKTFSAIDFIEPQKVLNDVEKLLAAEFCK